MADRMVAALERIAAALEFGNDHDPFAAVAPTLPSAPPSGMRVELPVPGYAVHTEVDPDAPEGFRLWLIGPAGLVRPLEWQG